MKAPLPANEALRLEALQGYAILDTPPDQAFDDLTLLAAQLCEVPKAMVSLVDDQRQWFKSRVGFDRTETDRDISFCAHTILQAEEVLEVQDARLDPRFASSTLVTDEPHIRFYAGAPLVTPAGFALGALCVMDTAPRALEPAQKAALQALARRVVAQLELRRLARELAQREKEADQMLRLAEKSRRALLSVLEDEKQSARNLRESETRFRQVVESIREVFWMTDISKQRLAYISPSYEHVWGRPSAELYTSLNIWVESIHPDDRTRVMHAATTKQAIGEYDETYRILRPDGAVRWVRDKAFPVKEADGTVQRVVGVAEDITDQKHMEEQFLHAQRMEAVGALASGVAHDLNNILAPILIVAGLLKETVMTARDQEMLAMIEQSSHRGAGIVRQLLTFSRGTPGERIAVQPKHLVHDMAQIMRETFPRNITITENVPRELWSVRADPTQLHQVIMNLCVNARDAMPSGGTLVIEAANRDLVADTPAGPALPAGPYVVLSVRDTGQGIAPNILARIFDPFFTTKASGKGTGLGLSTVAGIVKSHGGQVMVETAAGLGSVFLVYLPAIEMTEEAEPELRVPVDTGHQELILVVDDEAPIREAVSTLLEMQGYRVLVAGSGEEAVKFCIRHQGALRLVVTDMMMPGMSGLDLLRALRVLQPGLRMIACSGIDQEENHAEFMALGVTEFIPKPFAPTPLLRAIKAALAS